MNDSDDIANLFKQFGGEADQYREIGRSNEVKLAKERGPLLSSVAAIQPADVPPVDHKDDLAQAPVPSAGASALRSAPLAPQRPEAPAAVHVQPAALRQEPILNPDPVPLAAPRTEPSLSALPASAAEAPVAQVAMPVPAPPPVPAAATSTPAPSLPEPAPAPVAVVPAPAPAPVAVAPAPAPAPLAVAPAPAPVSAAPAIRTETPPASASDLQRIFARLARTPDVSGQADKNLTLLQRLSRL